MNAGRAAAVPLLLLGAAVLQAAVADRWTIFGVAPDFTLAVLGPIVLTGGLTGSLFAGFASGWLQGAMAGANVAHYVLSRTVGAFLLALVRLADLQVGIGLAAVATGLFTVAVRLGFMLLAPPQDIGPYLGSTMGSAVYNGVIAVPVFAWLTRLAGRNS